MKDIRIKIKNSKINIGVSKLNNKVEYVKISLTKEQVIDSVSMDEVLTSPLERNLNNINGEQVIPAFGYLNELGDNILLVSSINDYKNFILSNNDKFEIMLIVSPCTPYQALEFANMHCNTINISNYQQYKYVSYQLKEGRALKHIADDMGKSIYLLRKLLLFGEIPRELLSIFCVDSLTHRNVSDIRCFMKMKYKDPDGYKKELEIIYQYSNELLIKKHLRKLADDKSESLSEVLVKKGDCSVSVNSKNKKTVTFTFENVNPSVIDRCKKLVSYAFNRHY